MFVHGLTNLSNPLKFSKLSRSGGIGRRAGLKIRWALARVSSSLSSGIIVFPRDLNNGGNMQRIIKTNPFRLIGGFAPSSDSLALAMTRFVSLEKEQKILEVGAGTGAITKHLVDLKNIKHTIDVVEIYPIFANLLKRRFNNKSHVKIYNKDILEFEPEHKYDLIICSLPFNSMLPEMVELILKKIILLATSRAIMSFFEYKILQDFVKLFLTAKQRESYCRTRALITDLLDRYEFEQRPVSYNLPPALVHYLRLG